MRKKERKKELCDLWLATSKEKGKENRQVVGKACWHHKGTVSLVLKFVRLAMYLLNLHWKQQGRERKREEVRESPFINDTDNLIFLILLSLLHESCVSCLVGGSDKYWEAATNTYLKVVFFITITCETLFIEWFIVFRFWNILNLDHKKYIWYKIQPSLLTSRFL